MRAYYFGNMYLSSIQQGIQALHVTSEMYETYRGHHDKSMQIKEWATNHKTVVLLNAGYSEEIRALDEFFENKGNDFPWESFYEDEAALDGALTSIGIILPQRIYDTAKALRRREVWTKDYTPVRTQIENDGRVTFEKDNVHGITVEDYTDYPIVWEFNKWEYQLMDRLNQYGLAR